MPIKYVIRKFKKNSTLFKILEILTSFSEKFMELGTDRKFAKNDDKTEK